MPELTIKQQAAKMVNDIFNELNQISSLIPFDKQQEIATKIAITNINLILDSLPMYQGGLNPKWKYWTDVKETIQNLTI